MLHSSCPQSLLLYLVRETSREICSKKRSRNSISASTMKNDNLSTHLPTYLPRQHVINASDKCTKVCK